MIQDGLLLGESRIEDAEFRIIFKRCLWSCRRPTGIRVGLARILRK